MKIKVYIHIGPPKTATSAIQNWLQNNQEFLTKHGIYYPYHELDRNGVSSGNVLNVFDRNQDAKLVISVTKIKNLLQDCEDNKCDILLLSSEFFFFQVSDLRVAFPQAKFITYVRFPLDVIESSYNQSVKRHEEVKAFGIADEPQAYHLRLLELIIDKYAIEHFIIKFYSKSMFVKGDIICDFLSIFGIESEPDTKIVNSSYTFESLEVKRWLNQFLQSEYQERIDRFLQAVDTGTISYSLIHPKKYEYYQKHFLKKLVTFFEKYQVEKSEQYLDEIRLKQQNIFLTQQLKTKEFKYLMDKLAIYDKGMIYGLSRWVKKHPSLIIKRPEFVTILNSSVPKNYMIFTFIKERFYFIKYKIKQFCIMCIAYTTSGVNVPITDSLRIRAALKIDKSVSDAEIYRELALYCEQNGEVQFAYRLMKEANKLRPNGPVISAKLSQYQEELRIRTGTEKKCK